MLSSIVTGRQPTNQFRRFLVNAQTTDRQVYGDVQEQGKEVLLGARRIGEHEL